MHTPSAALAWELWRRHRARIVAILGLVLGFILVYPKLCALAGFNTGNPDPFEEIGKNPILRQVGGPSYLRIAQLFYILFLCCGPAAAMLLSLLWVIWMFTFTGFDKKTKDPMKFPTRLFTLPVSTPFLFWWFLLAGLAALVAFYASWVCLVPQPHIQIFGRHQNCLAWMTLLVLAQAITWALAAWPILRMLVLMAALFGFLGHIDCDWDNFFKWPIILPLGAALAYTGLKKMRCSQWQGWNWKWLATMAARAEWRGPSRFASPAQAQLWFEWRRFSGNVCFITAGLAWVPVVIYLLARVAFSRGPLSEDMITFFIIYLVGVPLFVHFCFGASPGRTNQPFLMVRSLTNGEMVMPMLKTAAISTAFSWLAVLAALGALPLLGDFRAVAQGISDLPGRIVLVLGLVFLTWRMSVVNLCFTLSGNRRLEVVPAAQILALVAGLFTLSMLNENGVYWGEFQRLVPMLLLCLVAVKFLLAFLAFRISIKRRLLAPSALVGYLKVWFLLVAFFLAAVVVLFLRHDRSLTTMAIISDYKFMLQVPLAIILLVPLARIGLCPIMLARYRHT